MRAITIAFVLLAVAGCEGPAYETPEQRARWDCISDGFGTFAAGNTTLRHMRGNPGPSFNEAYDNCVAARLGRPIGLLMDVITGHAPDR